MNTVAPTLHILPGIFVYCYMLVRILRVQLFYSCTASKMFELIGYKAHEKPESVHHILFQPREIRAVSKSLSKLLSIFAVVYRIFARRHHQ